MLDQSLVTGAFGYWSKVTIYIYIYIKLLCVDTRCVHIWKNICICIHTYIHIYKRAYISMYEHRVICIYVYANIELSPHIASARGITKRKREREHISLSLSLSLSFSLSLALALSLGLPSAAETVCFVRACVHNFYNTI